jgi:DNA processing protein
LQWGEARASDPAIGEAIARLLTKAPVTVDELIRQSGAPSAEVHMALLELELAGELERHAGGAVSRL